ncbi:hypothetical protein DFJ73DRAFT_780745 [Zopfochytrium polystomum]|nr:hypothetical protein DFJ73DRAFT_780745 [Zopfochytrium polystomum]
MLDGHPDNASASGVGRSGGPAGGDDSNRSSLNGEQPQQQEQQQVRHSTSLLESQKRATARNLDDSFDSASQSMSRSSWRNSSPGLDLPGTSRQLLHLHSLEQEDEDISSGHRSSEDDDDDEEDESSDPRDAMRAANRADSSEHKADRSVASATHRPLQIGMNRDSSGGLSSLARSLVPPAMAFTTSSSSSVSSASVLPMSSAGSFIAGVGKNRMPSPTRSVRSFRDIVLQRSGSVRSNASANVETRPLSGSSYPQEFEELLSEKETLQRELHYAAEVGQILLEQNEGLERSLAAANEKVEYLMAALAQVDGSGPDSFNEKSQSTALDREEHGMDMLALKYDDLKRDNARLEQELLQAKRSLMIAQKDEEAIRTNMSILSRENEALREDQRALIEGQAKLQEQHSAEINQRAIEANSDNADSQREAREVIQFLTDQLELYRERFGSSSAGASISATTANAVAAAAAAAAASSSATPSSVAASLSGGATTVGPMTAMTQAPPGFPPNSVNVGSIVRLMVGGWLKKFNRRRSKAERRFVNVNPYSRTLSWSKRDPADEQNTEVNTVYIQAVHIEDLTDGRSRIVIHAPLREIVLECNTPTEHAIWERVDFILIEPVRNYET